jgi:predicted MFS family arabinose efflux permease
MVAALGLPTPTVGAVLMPAGLALALSIPLAGRMLGRLALHRTIAAGLAAMGLSFAAMVVIGPRTAVVWIVVAAVVGRIGLGFVIPSLSIGAMRGTPPELIPFGSSATNFLRQIGGAIGVGLVGIGLEWRLRAHGPADALAAYQEVFAMMAALTLLSAWLARRMRSPVLAAAVTPAVTPAPAPPPAQPT